MITGYPKPPTHVSVLEVTTDSVLLSWRKTSWPRSVYVRYRLIDSRMSTIYQELFHTPGTNRVRVSGLSKDSVYEFFVAFVNDEGCSEASEPQYATTEPPGTAAILYLP